MSKYRNSGPAAGTLVTDAESIFFDAVQAAEAVRATALAAASSQAAAKAADIAFHRSVVQAARIAGNSQSNVSGLGGNSRQALRELTGGE